MQINYIGIEGYDPNGSDLTDHYVWLSSYSKLEKGLIKTFEPPVGFENYHVVDVLGPEFAWMNETFPKEKYTWYVWFESVFLVPDEMLTLLALRWS